MSDDEDRIITPNDAREEVGHKPLTEDDTHKITPNPPEPRTFSERFQAAKKFVNDHKTGVAYTAGAICGTAATLYLGRGITGPGAKAMVETTKQLIAEIHLSHKETHAAVGALRETLNFIETKGLTEEFLKAYPDPIIA